MEETAVGNESLDAVQADSQPTATFFGEMLDWHSELVDVFLTVELPFWLMVRRCLGYVSVNDYQLELEIRDDYYEVHAREFTGSRSRCIYLGPKPIWLAPELASEIAENNTPTLERKCKTILRMQTRCHADALAAIGSDQSDRRNREGMAYLSALTAAHIPAVNALIDQYRLATYDYFPFAVSPWDIPVWFLGFLRSFVAVPLLPYAEWDRKPLIEGQPFEFISPEDLGAATRDPSPGELDLLDGLMLMERGDYSGAVRRVTTALEVVIEARLRTELAKNLATREVDRKMRASRNDFPGRVRQWAKLRGVGLGDPLSRELERTRDLRHSIVHGGRRLTYLERGEAQRSVDTGRWIYNAIEDAPERAKLRESNLVLRSVGRFAANPLFEAEIGRDGAVVFSPAEA